MPSAPTALNQKTVSLPMLEASYQQPFLSLVHQAQSVHQRFHPHNQIQLCTLANIKSGNCAEDCAYCPQSARYKTGIETWALPTLEEIDSQIKAAKANGSTRFCMGAAWRSPPNEKSFNQVLAMVERVNAHGMEACATLGMITEDQARALKDAGLKAYNHNIDTSPNYYDQVITTRKIDDRLETLSNVAKAKLDICCGGILGMGETVTHRLEMIQTLCQLETPPESVPINCLVPVEGTPLADQKPVDSFELVRTIATTRIFLPGSRIRLSAGRLSMNDETQALCFMAGANSIFTGDKLLTTDNPGENKDAVLLKKLGLTPTT
ncbi:MAG: biotin synthase BioB [Cyanobacteria bacterium P01_H01_bin.74]